MRYALLLLALLAAPVAAAQPGALDPTFGGGDGFVTTDVNDSDFGEALLLQADGRTILAGGETLARYLSDGVLDPTFSDGGVVSITAPYWIRAAGLQPDGKIVVGGFVDGVWDAVLLRYLSDGTLDPTFGDEGVLLIETASDVQDLAILPDGKILLVGSTPSDRGYLARRFPDGTPDGGFGTRGDGTMPTLFRHYSCLAVQPDDKIVVAGFRDVGGGIVRFHTDGSVDTGFGDGGELYGLKVLNVAVRSDGRILALAPYVNASPYFKSYALSQVLPDGAPDATFGGGDGYVHFNLPFSGFYGALALQPDGRILVTGEASSYPSQGDHFLAQHLPDGTLDPTFGDEGSVITDFGPDVRSRGIAVQPDGRILTGGAISTGPGQADFLLVRSLGDGGTVAAEPLPVPEALALSAPSPHPLRAGARMTLSVPLPQAVRVGLYDALGREVAVLHDGALEAGAHALTLDGARLAAGVYVVRAEGAGGVAVRRVVRY